jgi:hypothetical protein
MKKYYSSKIATFLLACFTITYGVATFGNPTLFDRIYLVMIIGTAYLLRKNPDVLGVMIILAISHLMQDLVHYWNLEENTSLVKILVYSCVLGTIYKLWYDNLNKLALAIVTLAISAEIYWLATGYNSPNIYWYVFLVNQNLFIRHVLLYRTAYYRKYLLVKGTPTILDYSIEKVCLWFVVIDSIMIIEYLIRHVLKFDLLIMYNAFEYFVQAIGVYVIWVIIREYQYLLEGKIIKA